MRREAGSALLVTPLRVARDDRRMTKKIGDRADGTWDSGQSSSADVHRLHRMIDASATRVSPGLRPRRSDRRCSRTRSFRCWTRVGISAGSRGRFHGSRPG
ncbi:hypothetical protein RHCRD62_10837 [Rhodococcus sp. RD6.2]|nr:hypothetical protein RHCRD62_10837 [Rhodococcus sp. RD6.2]